MIAAVNHVNFSSLSTKDHFSFNLPAKEIHVWLINIDKVVGENLTLFEDGKAAELDSSLFQKRFKNSRKSLRYLLSRYLEISPELLHFGKTDRGKPLLLSHPEISFSIAHTDSLLVFAFARHPVGIDLERKRPVKFTAIAKKFFATHELDFLKHLTEERFFYLWTAKEAGLKADGCGITEGLRNASTVIEQDSITGLHLNDRFMSIIPWCLKEELPIKKPLNIEEASTIDSSLENDHIGSVASFVPPSLIRWYDLRAVDSLVS